jgi:signal transduction histidine kinase
MIASDMATVSGASLDSDSAAVAERRIKPHWAALAAGLVICALYLALPERFVLVREEFLYVGLEFAAAAAILVGVHLYRPAYRTPWYLIAAGWTLWALGDLLWGVYALRDEEPFPSVADAFYLAGYPAIAAGAGLAARRRFAERDRGAALDVLVLTTAVGLLLWVYVIDPLRADADPGMTTELVTIAYPLGDLLLLAAVARFLVGDAWRVPAFRWLTGAFAVTLLADLVYLFAQVGWVNLDDRYINTIFLLGSVLVATAALGPSMRLLTERIYTPTQLPGLIRLVLIALAALLPFAVLVVQVLRDEPAHLPVILGTAAVLFSAALIRWGSLLTDQRRTTKRESTLRAYAGELLHASGEQELLDVAERTAQELVSGGSARIARTADGAVPGPHRFVAELVVRGEPEAVLVADGSAAEINRLTETLTSVTTQLALALERERLLTTERETATALSKQNERLRELDEMKDQFVSSVSHELRTPLTSMIGYLELTLDGEAGELTEEQKHFLGIVSRNCTRLTKLIDDILFVARVDAGRLSLDPEWVAPAEVAWVAVESAQAAADRQGVELHFSADDRLPPLWADPTRLAQMLDNLIANAIKFTPEGGAVTVAVGQRGDSVHVEVADTGVGIPEDEVGRLFERFFRASTGSSIQGTGLGLSIVKSIVEVHGGTVSVESKPGAGTTFTVDLPLPGLPGAPSAPDTTEVTA